MILGAAGVGIDLAKAYNVKRHLSRSIDAAALAGATSELKGDPLKEFIKEFVIVNFDNVGDAELLKENIDVNITDETSISISATATSLNTIMPFFNKDTVTVGSFAKVVKNKKVEVVLALDNTASMNSNNNIKALRDASINFTNTLFDFSGTTDRVKVGVVPYSANVNPGKYIQPYLIDPLIPYTDDVESGDWMGCVIEPYSTDLSDSVNTPLKPFRFCRDDDDNVVCKKFGSSKNKRNYNCPQEPILPLTSKKGDVVDTLNSMNTAGSTNGTLSSIGMLWAYRTISPAFPFKEGSPYGDKNWLKVVVLMTDGKQNFHPGTYNAYGFNTGPDNTKLLDDRLEDICKIMKSKKIDIYTITFGSGINASTKKNI